MMKVRFLIILFLLSLPASAALPEAIVTEFQQHYQGAKERPDGLMQAGSKNWVLFKTNNTSQSSEIKLVIKDGDDFLFSSETNDWVFTPLENNTVKSFDFFNPQIQAKILATNIVQTFLVPSGFQLPRDLAITMGRLPIELRTVELASDRELRFRERLKQEESSTAISAISYSIKSGALTQIRFTDKAEVKLLTEQSVDLSYVSSLKNIDGDLYLLDYHKAKLFQLNEKGELKEFLSLAELGIKGSLKDFALVKETHSLYLLNAVKSELLVVDYRTKKLIKAISVASGCSDLMVISRSPSEPAQVMMVSRANSSITTINSFDYKISSQFDLNSLNKDFDYIPQAITVNESKILVAVEALVKNSQVGSAGQGKLLALDPVTNELISSVDLEYIPYDLLLSKDNKQVYVLGSNKEAAFVSSIDLRKLYLLQTANLAPDIVDPRTMIFSNAANFLVISSAGTHTVAVFDIATWSMVYKIDIGDSSNSLARL